MSRCASGLQRPQTLGRHACGFCRTFCSGGHERGVAPVRVGDAAASAEPGAVAGRPALPAATTSGRCWSRGLRARPPRVAGAACAWRGAGSRPARVWPGCATARASYSPWPWPWRAVASRCPLPPGRCRRGHAWASGGRERKGDATAQRPPSTRRSGGPWAPVTRRALVSLPHAARVVIEGDHTANGLKGKSATKPNSRQNRSVSWSMTFDGRTIMV